MSISLRTFRRLRSPLGFIPRTVASLVLLLALAAPRAADAQAGGYTFTAEDVVTAAGGIVNIGITLDAPGTSDGASTAVCHDPSIATVTQINEGAAVVNINGGNGPDFFSFTMEPTGFTGAMVFNLFGTFSLPAGNNQELFNTTYQVAVTAPTGITQPLSFCMLGQPAVENVVVVNGASVPPVTNDGSIMISGPFVSTDFIRGDTNADGSVTVTDAVVLFGELFGSIPVGPCPRSGDLNNDGLRNISDVITLLMSLLSDGPAFIAPYPNCGTAISGLTCNPTPICP